MDDLLLVEASQAGDKAAFSSLIDRYYRNVYRLAYSFKGWIFTIASNLLRRRIKDMKVEKRLAARSSSGSATESAENEDGVPSAKMAAEETTAIVRRQVQEMPEHIRLVTILVIMEGLSRKEAAAVLNCSEATVCRRLEAATEWLRARLRSVI
jgi:RNA polymerase sigma-70 factor (ECF subfamily)